MPEKGGIHSACANSGRDTCISYKQPNPLLWPRRLRIRVVMGPMKEETQKLYHPATPLNRRKPENRWTRILRDADRDQYETVRRWLKLAGDFVGRNRSDEDDETRVRDLNKAA